MAAKCRVEPVELTFAQLQEMGSVGFPGLLGIEFEEAGDGFVRARLALEEKHMAPNGYLHAGTVVGFADSACGYGCILNLPDGATGFTTIELEDELPPQRERGDDRLRGADGARRADDAALGRDGVGSRGPGDGALPLHTADPALAPRAVPARHEAAVAEGRPRRGSRAADAAAADRRILDLGAQLADDACAPPPPRAPRPARS